MRAARHDSILRTCNQLRHCAGLGMQEYQHATRKTWHVCDVHQKYHSLHASISGARRDAADREPSLASMEQNFNVHLALHPHELEPSMEVKGYSSTPCTCPPACSAQCKFDMQDRIISGGHLEYVTTQSALACRLQLVAQRTPHRLAQVCAHSTTQHEQCVCCNTHSAARVSARIPCISQWERH